MRNKLALAVAFQAGIVFELPFFTVRWWLSMLILSVSILMLKDN